MTRLSYVFYAYHLSTVFCTVACGLEYHRQALPKLGSFFLPWCHFSDLTAPHALYCVVFH
ncbi:Uncharacterised protein [Vibrio cholerae]|nr:Uncharacterised protein [Vibrio cholerae]